LLRNLVICFLLIQFLSSDDVRAQRYVQQVAFDCFGDSMTHRFTQPVFIDTSSPVSQEEIEAYCRQIPEASFAGLVNELKKFKEGHKLDDWLYYQLIRRIADQLAPKSANYHLYTIYKWYLLKASGFDAILAYADGTLLFYVHCEENIYNIPIRRETGKNYVCLNYHDYGFKIDFEYKKFNTLRTTQGANTTAFSYRVSSLPNVRNKTVTKDLQFTYNEQDYHFRVKLNGSVSAYFKNYPVTDYEKHFNIPMSADAYQSLIPALKKQIKGLPLRDGVDFLMHFTRYAFLFKPDTENYGRERIYSPELTLLNESSDCEDRVSLFYYLVKEIYDLPMVVLVYPKHVSIGIKFPKSFGQTVEYNGQKFTVCEPTPQTADLKIGEANPSISKLSYQVAFAYEPKISRLRKK
jgi:hypothetical protein